MSASYYYAIKDNNPNDELKLADVESIRNFLIKNREATTLFHTHLSEIKIEYDTETGKVDVFPREESQSVKTSYNNGAFEKKISDVEEAISQFARYELLHKLSELHDPEINNIIKRHKLTFDGQDSPRAIDKALTEMMSLIKPLASLRFFSTNQNTIKKPSLQHAVYRALEENGIYKKGIKHIKSMECVTKIMETLQANMPSLALLKTRHVP